MTFLNKWEEGEIYCLHVFDLTRVVVVGVGIDIHGGGGFCGSCGIVSAIETF